MASESLSEEKRIQRVRECIATYPDFPSAGIIFRDIFSLTRAPEIFSDCISLLVEHIRSVGDVDVIVGLDSRGFIFGPLIAQQLNKPFVPIRKAGKLPGETIRVKYSLEYGEDEMEMQKGSVQEGQRVIVVDDLLATGGTMKAACELLQIVKAVIPECVVVIELSDLKGRSKIPANVFSLINF